MRGRSGWSRYRAWSAAAVLLAGSGCGGGADPVRPDRSVESVVALGGQDQTAWPRSPLPADLVVQVLDGEGGRVTGVEVRWVVATGGRAVSPSASVTGSDGIARTTWTLGRASVEQTVTASASGRSAGFRAEMAVEGEWEAIPELLHPVRAPAATTDGERIYVVGGSTGASPRTAYLQIFDPATGSWTRGADAPSEVEWAGAVHRDGEIHVLGGVTDAAAASANHWVYDVARDAWSAGVPLPAPAAGAAVGLVGDRILVAGGIDGPGAHSDHVHVYDFATGTWSSGSPVPAKRINWQGGILDGSLFVAGGLGPGQVTARSLYRYDPDGDAWASLQPLPVENEAYAGTVVAGLYCVLGGRTAPSSGSFAPPYDRVDCYEPEASSWLPAPDLPTAVEEAAGVTLDGALYVLGGRVSFGGVTGAAYRLAP